MIIPPARKLPADEFETYKLTDPVVSLQNMEAIYAQYLAEYKKAKESGAFDRWPRHYAAIVIQRGIIMEDNIQLCRIALTGICN